MRDDMTFAVTDDGTDLELCQTAATDKLIVLSMTGVDDESPVDGKSFLLVGLTAKQARKLGVRLIEQAGVLS